MKFQTLDELEASIGGRPTLPSKKCRMSFYLSPREAIELRNYAVRKQISVSSIVRDALRDTLSGL